MNPKVQEFINSAKELERERYEKERDAILIGLGLCEDDGERVYNPDKHAINVNTALYPYYDEERKEWYRTNAKPKAITVTDEEYEEILKYADKTGVRVNEQGIVEQSGESSTSEKILSVFNVLFMLSAIVSGIILLCNASWSDYSALYISAGIVSMPTPISKFSWLLWVCAAQRRSAGTFISPIESCSIRYSM